MFIWEVMVKSLRNKRFNAGVRHTTLSPSEQVSGAKLGPGHVLPNTLNACPTAACSCQGLLSESFDGLVNNDMGNSSGWKQSKQNWVLLAVVGQ